MILWRGRMIGERNRRQRQAVVVKPDCQVAWIWNQLRSGWVCKGISREDKLREEDLPPMGSTFQRAGQIH